MKIFSEALIGAIAIHSSYFTTTLAVGYVKTMNYKPDWEVTWGNVENMQSEVAFGYAPSPFLYVCAFLGIVLACGILLSIYDKLSSNSSGVRES